MSGFLERFSGQLAVRWTAQMVGPLLFWIGGSIGWTWRAGWTRTAKQLAGLSAEESVLLAVCELVVLVFSAALAQRLARPVLRFLEGYWHPRVERLRQRLADRHCRKLARLDQRFQELAGIQDRRELSAPEREEYVRLDYRLRCAPVRPKERMPTRLGNIIRAAESCPASKYLLDAMVCWPNCGCCCRMGRRKTWERRARRSTREQWLGFGAFSFWCGPSGPGGPLRSHLRELRWLTFGCSIQPKCTGIFWNRHSMSTAASYTRRFAGISL